MARIYIKGTLYERTRDGRGFRKGYFVLIADGKMIRNLGSKKKDGYIVDRAIYFKRRLLVIAKGGPSGLEGSKPDGGVWFTVVLVPSDRERVLTLRLPYHDSAEMLLELRGMLDVYKMESCDWCREEDFIRLGETLDSVSGGN